MKFPDYPASGHPVSAAWGRQLLDFVRSITPRSSRDVLVSTLSGGTTFALLARSRVASAATSRRVDFAASFRVEVKSGGEDSAITITGGYVGTPGGNMTEIDGKEIGVIQTGKVYLTYTRNERLDSGEWSELLYGVPPASSTFLRVFVLADVTATGTGDACVLSIVQRRLGDIEYIDLPASVVTDVRFVSESLQLQQATAQLADGTVPEPTEDQYIEITTAEPCDDTDA